MNPAEKFGHRVRVIRRTRKLKIGELAEKADTGVKHLGRIERGEKQPSFELIISLATALNVSPAALFDFDSLSGDPNASRRRLAKIFANLKASELPRIERLLTVLLDP